MASKKTICSSCGDYPGFSIKCYLCRYETYLHELKTYYNSSSSDSTSNRNCCLCGKSDDPTDLCFDCEYDVNRCGRTLFDCYVCGSSAKKTTKNRSGEEYREPVGKMSNGGYAHGSCYDTIDPEVRKKEQRKAMDTMADILAHKPFHAEYTDVKFTTRDDENEAQNLDIEDLDEFENFGLFENLSEFQKDILLIMSQTGANQEDSTKAFKENDGNIVESIKRLIRLN